MSDGRVFWITGLSGSGKTTLCRLLVDRLRANGRAVVMLDGDEVREILGATDVYTDRDRRRLALQYARLCRLISAQGVDVAIATISLFREVHDWNRANLPGYVEIYLKMPFHELVRRDPKGIYARAARGELHNVAGLDVEVDMPANPDITIEHAPYLTAEHALERLWQRLQEQPH